MAIDQLASEKPQSTATMRDAGANLTVGVYFSPLRAIRNPTGVGRHMARMTEELGRIGTVAASLLVSSDACAGVGGHLPAALRHLSVRQLPGPERLLRYALLAGGPFAVDRWSGRPDWIYCPKEQPIKTRHSRLAVTVHDMLSFEDLVRGLENSRSIATRARWQVTMSLVLSRADLILTVSEFTKSRLLEMFPIRDANRVVVVGNGVDQTFYRSQNDSDREILSKYRVQNRRYIMAVGSLTSRKGADILLGIAERLKQLSLDLVILVAGRRHDFQYRKLAESLTNGQSEFPLRTLGYVPDEELAALLSHSAALVFPSRYEGFGIPTIEAMAAGTPVICSRVAALPEVVGDAGVLVRPDSPDEFLDAVRELDGSNDCRRSLIDRGRKRAAQFTWARCADRLLAAFVAA